MSTYIVLANRLSTDCATFKVLMEIMFMKQGTTVLIVGAGPVGLTAACELLHRGVRCRIIDQAAGPSQFSKAFAVHARTLEVFDGMGIADDLSERGTKVRSMHFYHRAKRTVSIDFSGLDTRFPYVLSVPQSQTEAVLRGLLAALGGKVEQGRSLTKLTHDTNGVSAVLRDCDGTEEVVSCGWMVAADGAHSTVRRELNIGWSGETYNINFLVADGYLASGPSGSDGHTYLTDAGYVMLFPLPGGAHRVVLDLSHEESLGHIPQAGDVNRLLAQRGLPQLRFRDPFWLSEAHIHRMLASNYRQGRVFLAGDAAHIHSPVGGQGLNTGIQDAHNLAWKLAMVIKGRANAGLLDSYELERRAVAAEVLASTDTLTRTLTERNRLRRVIRTYLFPLVAALPPVRRRLPERAAGLSIDYSGSPLVAPGRRSRGIAAGQRAPNGIAHIQGNGNQKGFQADLLGIHYVLLLFLGDSPSAHLVRDIEARVKELAPYGDTIKTSVVTLAQSQDLTSNLHCLVDLDGQLHSRYTGGVAGIRLIRPDNYIALAADLAAWEELTSFLSSHLTSRDGDKLAKHQAPEKTVLVSKASRAKTHAAVHTTQD